MELVCERSFRALVALRGQELRPRGDKPKECALLMLAQSADRSPNSPSLIRFRSQQPTEVARTLARRLTNCKAGKHTRDASRIGVRATIDGVILPEFFSIRMCNIWDIVRSCSCLTNLTSPPHADSMPRSRGTFGYSNARVDSADPMSFSLSTSLL